MQLRERQRPMVDFSQLEVRDSGLWIWQVHENQSYLGRIIFRLKRGEVGSMAQCTGEEWISLLEEVRAYERMMKRLFSPARFNYGQLGNVYHQLHVHAVPRYDSTRTWNNVVFSDARWGQNWAPTPTSPLTVQQTYDFARWLKRDIPRNV